MKKVLGFITGFLFCVALLGYSVFSIITMTFSDHALKNYVDDRVVEAYNKELTYEVNNDLLNTSELESRVNETFFNKENLRDYIIKTIDKEEASIGFNKELLKSIVVDEYNRNEWDVTEDVDLFIVSVEKQVNNVAYNNMIYILSNYIKKAMHLSVMEYCNYLIGMVAVLLILTVIFKKEYLFGALFANSVLFLIANVFMHTYSFEKMTIGYSSESTYIYFQNMINALKMKIQNTMFILIFVSVIVLVLMLVFNRKRSSKGIA